MTDLRHHHFSMLELIYALIVFSILMTIIIGQTQLLQRARHHHLQQSRAILVIDNTLEQIRALRPLSPDAVDTLLAREFQLMDVPRRHQLAPRTEWSDRGLTLAIIRLETGHPIVRVEVPR